MFLTNKTWSIMILFRTLKKIFFFAEIEDLVVVDMKTKMIQSMSSKEWGKLKNKQNFMIVK